jgi:hypothetical protein
MSESIWWPDEAWYERKSLPLGFITLSFRQLGTILLSLAAAFLVSLPFSFPIAGASFGGRAAVFCVVFGVGYFISSRPVRLVPTELQVVYVIRTKGLVKLRAVLRGRNAKESKQEIENREPTVQEILVEDFKTPIPLVVSETVSQMEHEAMAQLLLDGQLRGEDLVSPQKPRFRFVFRPLPEDIGMHDLTVRLEGSAVPLLWMRLSIKGRSTEANEAIVKIG